MLRQVPYLLLVSGLISACTSDATTPRAASTWPARQAPVADAPPYVCDLVPEQGFRQITGLAESLASRKDGPQVTAGLCLASARGRNAPLGIQWSLRQGEQVLQRQLDASERSQMTRLPATLGRGLSVIWHGEDEAGRPNYVLAVFHCGGKQPWISIDFVPVVKGRDAHRDMADLMRIAQRRFGELHGCTPKP